MFIVNKRGAVHSVNEGTELPEGSRPATPEEIADWYKRQGLKPPKAEAAKPTQGEGQGTGEGQGNQGSTTA